MSRSDDMMYSGMRHPFLGEYRAGFTKDGVLTSYELELFSNTGYSTDLGTAVSSSLSFFIYEYYSALVSL